MKKKAVCCIIIFSSGIVFAAAPARQEDCRSGRGCRGTCMSLPVTRTLYMHPGFLCVPTLPTRLCTIIASGVAVTVFDRRNRLGGVGHYSHPLRVGEASTPEFAAPALVGLFRMFKRAGSDLRNLEICVYGGADNPLAPGFESCRGILNTRMGFEILARLGVRPAGSDVGGRFARKLVFYTGTGESMLAKVDDYDVGDWYPHPAEGIRCRREEGAGVL